MWYIVTGLDMGGVTGAHMETTIQRSKALRAMCAVVTMMLRNADRKAGSTMPWTVDGVQRVLEDHRDGERDAKLNGGG